METEVHVGVVIWFNVKKGFGFIEWHKDNVKQKDMFMHFSDISMSGFKTINAGQKVTFEIGANKNGDAKAINITAVKDQ